MSKKYKGRIEGPFVALLKDTIKTEAWKALSHGARSLYVALRSRYNLTTQNAVYVSTRRAKEELGRHSNLHSLRLWFRELQHYGFIVEVSPAHHGVNGHGKAPHYRLTEAWYLGKAPTRDFLAWDGSPFTEKRKRSAPLFTAKNRIRGDHGVTTLVTTGTPLVPEIVSEEAKSGDHGYSMSDDKGGDHGYSITSLTTLYADPDLLSAFEAMWAAPPVAIPFKDLKLKRLYQPPAKRRPDKRAEATYLAAWYQIEQEGGEKVSDVVPMPADFSNVRTPPRSDDRALLGRRDEVQATQDLQSQTQTRSQAL
jgi:hypothetical protein